MMPQEAEPLDRNTYGNVGILRLIVVPYHASASFAQDSSSPWFHISCEVPLDEEKEHYIYFTCQIRIV